MLSCLQACAGSAGAAGVDSAATKKPVQVRWPQDKLKTGKNGELLLRVYVVEDQQVEERELESTGHFGADVRAEIRAGKRKSISRGRYFHRY